MNWLAAAPYLAGLLILLVGVPLQSSIATLQARSIRTSIGRSAEPADDDLSSREIPDKISDGMDRMQAFAALITTTPALVLGLGVGHLVLFFLTLGGFLALALVLTLPIAALPMSWRLPIRLTWQIVGTGLFLLGATIVALLIPASQV